LREKYKEQNILIWIEKLETLLFKGKTHFKRGQGIQELPSFILNKSIQNFNVYKKIHELFISELNIDINN
jgi:hypothetical protein